MSLLTAFIVAVSLSMDAFSLALIYGTFNIDNRKSIIISIMVGIFHFFMPLMGYTFGDSLSKLLTINVDILMAIIFIYLGIQMFISIFKDEEVEMINSFLSTLLFAFTVSIDSFTVGVGLGLDNNKNYLNFLIFSIVSSSFTYLGLKLGTILSNKFGKFSIGIGSITLVLLGTSHLL